MRNGVKKIAQRMAAAIRNWDFELAPAGLVIRRINPQ
jgi:hypothetical protein